MATLESDEFAGYIASITTINSVGRSRRGKKATERYLVTLMQSCHDNDSPHVNEASSSTELDRTSTPRRRSRWLLTTPSDASRSSLLEHESHEDLELASTPQSLTESDTLHHTPEIDLAPTPPTTSGQAATPISKIYVLLHQQLEPADDDPNAIDSNYSIETVAAFTSLANANRQAWIVLLDRHPEFGLPGHIRPRSDDDDSGLGKYIEWFKEEDGTLELWCCSIGTAVDYKVWVSEVPVDDEG